MKNGFFAYGSDPSYCGEFIEGAIEKINSSLDGVVKIRSWKEMIVSGKLIITKVMEEINKADFFCADLTNLNNNVLFELGFAISKKKSIWLILDTSNIESNKKFKELNFFSTIGYSSYSKSDDIVNTFIRSRIYEQEELLSDTLFQNTESSHGEKALFYIKSQIDTNYNQEIINEIERVNLPYIIDDSAESKVQSISWYVEQLFSVPAVLVEYSSFYRVGYELQNSKCAFISGMALGLDLKLLMVAEKPFPDTPIDYRELLQKYTSREMCVDLVRPFLEDVQSQIARLLLIRRKRSETKKARSNLQKINFGEYIAEHESDNLYDYYVQSTHYQNILKNEYNIIIGRKGTGKTATLYYLQQELQNDVRNHVCLIKPISFEIEGLVTLLNNLSDDFERGYTVEAIWKFLIYSEIAKSIYVLINEKQDFAKSVVEKEFLKYVEKNSKIVLTDFSTRLEQQLENLNSINVLSQHEFKGKVSEFLHDNIIKNLRNHIVKLIRNGGKLVILIDNLDKSWKRDSNINMLSKYILGLLSVVGRIARDFRGNPNEKLNFSFHLTLFLRSDIFKYVINNAREPDKIEFSRLSYSDPEVFFRIIEERFIELSAIDVEANELFEDYICKNVNGIELKRYILDKVFPRPRDIIYFFTSAKNFAVSRGHEIINEDDIISAYSEYSNWVFKSVLVENGITIQQVKEFMYNLMGESQIITLDKIKELAIKSNIECDSEEQLEYFIDHLVSLSILGREVKKDVYEFDFDFDSNEKLKALATKVDGNNFKVHNALASYLECI